MKQSFLAQRLIGLFSKLDINRSYILDGFDLDLFLSLYHALNVPALILLPDNLFYHLIKYLSVLQENHLVAFIPPVGVGVDGPAGFIQENSFHIQRSRGLLSSGLGSVSFIVCAESGLSVPMVGDGRLAYKLDFSSPVSFDGCLDFFVVNNYRCVDVVMGPGEYCVRGGILDVYPFAAKRPVRLSFLDGSVDVRYFDVYSQLSMGRVEGFFITSQRKQSLLPLKSCSLEEFLCLFYRPGGTVDLNAAQPVGFSEIFTCLSFKDFMRRGGVENDRVCIDNALCSVGVVDAVGNFIVPGWFVDASPVVSSPKKMGGAVPLAIATIKKGDYLVHRDHGVGIYMGLIGGNGRNNSIQEFLSIKYEDGGVVRLDTGHLDLIDYYAAADTEGVSLDSLQKKTSWLRKRRAASRCAKETIEYLLNMYVRRNDVSRAAFVSCNDMEHQFLNDFPYKDTADQSSAWRAISDDLSSLTPMDRLLCGDVGFGKTEIALRATFRVVFGGRRVLVLAPTTLLASQLYTSFYSRLNPYAINVGLVSRFRSLKKIRSVQEKIISEENDVLVGTHSVLNNDIYLKNIGLLVIDEEHRFGVKQKEKIRCFKESVDVLSMSATPIPRSLNLALSGIYSISLLQTPPLMRLPIITRVDYFNDRLICDAVSFEVGRGGQVYFVHNNIKSIEHVTGRLRALLPEMAIIFIHGRERPREVEEKMGLFVSNDVHVLVCTSIIEAGIDVPNANCIIINNSHLLGLSQLYQIRGRVGRSYRQAYAYLLVPRGLDLSDRAFGRIKTIEENTRLGSGYNISRSDMALRGSGSLFGYKQSGGSGSVGYEMYLRLIRRALHKSGTLQTEFVVLPEDVLIDVFEFRGLPKDYISHDSLRLSFYKSLSSASCIDEIDTVLYHLTDRFGPPPLPVNNLVHECRLRLFSAAAGVLSIRAHGCGLVCKIIQNDDPDLAPVILEYLGDFWGPRDVDFHVLPISGPGLSVCIHLLQRTDKYSLLSLFLDKLKALA